MIAVVVAATDSAEAVRRCVASIGHDSEVRVIVAYDPARIDRRGLPSGVAAAQGEPGANAHRLRRLGLAVADAPIVAFTEDSCVLGPGWAHAWVATFSRPEIVAATGPVDVAPNRSVVDRAVFLCEYAPFLPAGCSSNPSRLAGNNFAARSEILAADEDDLHEFDVQVRSRANGGRVATAAFACAIHARGYTAREAIRDRLRFGFGYGRLRAGSFIGDRLAHVVFGPLIVSSQVARLFATLARKRCWHQITPAVAVVTVLFLTAWSVGEWLGWVLGPSPKVSRTSGAGAVPATSRGTARGEIARPSCRPEPVPA